MSATTAAHGGAALADSAATAAAEGGGTSGTSESSDSSQQSDTADAASPARSDRRPRSQRGGRGGRGGKRARPPAEGQPHGEGPAPAAATAGIPATHPPRANAAGGKARPPQSAGAPQQPRKVHPVLQRLFELYPTLFGARFLPLKLGVYQELLERHGDEFKAEDLKIALGLHARSTRYLDAVAAGHARHDLDGQPVEPVAPEHIHHAILEVFRRRQSRSPDDLSGQLRTRIIAAIEASGIGRDAYAERVRARDAYGNAALDDALAELGRQGAKREALMRAFQASGKTEAEFADMYGMEVREVTRTLQRARKDRADEEAFAAAAAAAAEASASTTAETAETPDAAEPQNALETPDTAATAVDEPETDGEPGESDPASDAATSPEPEKPSA